MRIDLRGLVGMALYVCPSRLLELRTTLHFQVTESARAHSYILSEEVQRLGRYATENWLILALNRITLWLLTF